MINPISYVKNTRTSYSKFLEKSVREVQVQFDDENPRSYLIIGREYIIEKVDVRSQHTKIKLYNKTGWFNSVCFELKDSGVNSSLEYLKDMDPDSIQLETTSKLFEYEKLSREIENCEDLDTMKEMARCFIKLYLRHQEVTTQIMKMP